MGRLKNSKKYAYIIKVWPLSQFTQRFQSPTTLGHISRYSRFPQKAGLANTHTPFQLRDTCHF